MTQNIYLYQDEGASDFSLFSAQSYFKNDNISFVSASQIIEEEIPDSIDLFIMPGGADRPYARKLNGTGNQVIRHYVENGGTYLGICAGAYYGCQNIEFQKNTPEAICEERELGFFKGTATGCLKDIALPYDETLKSAAVTSITQENKTYATLYWGGCYFSAQQSEDFDVIAYYDSVTGQPPAIISCPVGKGKAVLSGVHFEVTAEDLLEYSFQNQENNDLKNALTQDCPIHTLNIKNYL